MRVAFDVAVVELPLDFRVDARALEDAPRSPAASVTEELVAAAAARRKASLDAVWRDVRHKVAEKLFQEPVAAALIAAEAGVDVAPFLARVNAEVVRSRAATPSSS